MTGQRTTPRDRRGVGSGLDVVEADVHDMTDGADGFSARQPLERLWNEFVSEAIHVVAAGRSDVVLVELPDAVGGADGRDRSGASDGGFVCVVGPPTPVDADARVITIRHAGHGDVIVLEATDPLTATRRRGLGSRDAAMRLGIASVVALVALGAWILAQGRSAFMDEEISLVMGLRSWEGLVGSDGFRRWVTGSPVSPVISAAAAHVGGLTGARLLSSVFTVAACLVVAVAAASVGRVVHPDGRSEGTRSGDLGLLTFAAVLCSAPVLVLATQVTHDTLGSLALACAFGAAAMARIASRRLWLAIAALWVGVAGVIAYAAFAMVIPLLALAVTPSVTGSRFSDAAEKTPKRRTDVVLAVMVFALAPTVMLSLYGADIDALRRFLQQEAPVLSSPRPDLAVEFAWILAVPMLLAVAGVVGRRRRARAGAVRVPSGVELLALATMPTAHLVSGVGQASLRHCAYGIIAAAPLLGDGARFLVGRRPRLLGAALVLTMAVVGVGQARALNRSWTDLGPALDLLVAQAEPGDRVVTVHEWPVAGLLYREGVLSSPWDVSGPDRQRALGGPIDVCNAQWYVEDLSRPGGSELRAQVESCGTFVEALRYEHRVDAAPGSGDRGGDVTVSVWRNEGADT